MNVSTLVEWMKRTTLFALMVCVLVLFGISHVDAATAKKSSAKDMNDAAAAATASNPMGCKLGQMRCATMQHRWAAAARSADRRAAQQKKQHKGGK